MQLPIGMNKFNGLRATDTVALVIVKDVFVED